MWSKFTEYAEGIVEIVAQADAVAASTSTADTQSPPPSSSSATAASTAERAITGEEIWSRFTSIVAPPAAAIAAAATAPLSQKRERQAPARAVEEAPRSAPPSLDQLRRAQAEAQRQTTTATVGKEQEPLSSSAKMIDEDEQEQYICELERALLQRKKQNEVLEKKVYELEYHHAQELQQERTCFAQQLADKERLLAEQALEIETFRQQQVPVVQQSDEVVTSSGETKALEAKVELLEQRLRDLNARLATVQSQYDHPSVELLAAGGGNIEVATATSSSSNSYGAATLDSLIEILRLLSATLDSADAVEPFPTRGNGDVVTQILSLAKQVNAQVETKDERGLTLEHAISSFLALHGEVLPTDSSAEQNTSEMNTQMQAKLDRITQRLSRSAADATEATRLQVKLHALEDKEEEQLKKILHLQAQVSSMQANMQKTDKSLQQTVSKEVELLDVIEENDETIRRLEGNVAQMKTSMEHLAGELKEAQSYSDELEGFCRRQKKELDVQRGRVKELEQAKVDFEALQEQERNVRARASEYEQGYVDLLAEIEKLKAENEEESKLLVANTEAHAVSAENQTIYELESRLSASEADKQVAVQDAERLQQDLDALEGVLHQFQLDQKQQRERLHELEGALEIAQEQLEHSQQVAAKQVSSDSESDLQRVMDVLAKKTLECDQLREALENTAARYTADNEVLDKRLAAQLVVTYCETEKKGEVLQLMAGMMGFSEEQKRRVGLGFPIDGNGGGGLFSSILGFVAPANSGNGSTTTPADLEGKSFADIWTEFLIDEAAKK